MPRPKAEELVFRLKSRIESIRLRGRITMENKTQALQKRLTAGTQAILIDILNKGRL